MARWDNTNKNIQRIVINYKPNSKKTGVEFDLPSNKILYSPALIEDKTVKLDLAEFNPAQLYLPLPNGLLGIEDKLFIIKHNEFMNICCCIDKSASKIRYEIENPKPMFVTWVLTVIKGSKKEALGLANRINISPLVYL